MAAEGDDARAEEAQPVDTAAVTAAAVDGAATNADGAIDVIEIIDDDHEAEEGDGDENGEDEDAPVEEVEADEVRVSFLLLSVASIVAHTSTPSVHACSVAME